LIKATDALRRAHADRLSGGKADVNAAESGHREALKAAADEIRGILKEAGETASGATMNAVSDTLHALPGPDAPGRLTRPLKPRGLEALAGLVSKSGFPRIAEAARPSKASGPVDKAAEKRDASAAKREAALAKREAEALEERRREARAAEKDAAAALAKARASLAKTQKERDSLQDRVRFLIKQIDDQVDEVAKLERALAEATDAKLELG
jgi:hypothetical protein